MEGADGKPLKIVQKIAGHDYTTFGMCLLQDENGVEVALIEKDHIIRGAESVTQAILQKWLTSDAPTRTYQHLIDCLRKSELGALAELIERQQSSNALVLAPQDALTCFSTSTDNPIPKYVSYLRGLYTSMSQSHTGLQHWSHLPRCEFVQLAMIGSGDKRRGDREEEMVRLAQQGRIETIVRYKEPIDLNNIFSTMQPLVVLPPPTPPRVILIEGAPGGGKSTLALHICHRWAQGNCSMKRYDLVILVYLRDQSIQNASTLVDLLPPRNSQIVASQIQDCDGKNVLFIFDGWDEFQSHLQKTSLVSTIIQQPHKLSLHQSTVLITTRPVSSGNLLRIADQRVEILGFTQHQIREYIGKALDGNSARIQKLVQHLEKHPVIEGYCYVPLHVAILVHVFLTFNEVLPTTLHDLFCKLVLCSIARELETHESESFESCSLDDLPDEFKSKLSKLSLLAYEGVMQDKVVFYEKDVKLVDLSAKLSLGLLQAVEGLTLLSKSLSYNFLHLSVQELLAAYHISHMDSSEQLKVFKRMFGGSRFQAVLHYYSGFTKLTSPPIRDFVSSYSKQKSSIKDLLPLLNCFFEAQDLSLSNLVNFRIIRLHSHLSPVDYLAIGYYITSLLSVSSSDTSNVQLKILEIDDQGLKLLLLALLKIRSCAARLEIEIVFSTNIIEKTRLIASFLEQSSVVSKLVIEHKDSKTATEVFPSFAKVMRSNSSLTSLTITYLSYQRPEYEHTCEEDLQVVKNMFEINNSLTQFSLSGTEGFACCIFQELQRNKYLTHLKLRQTGLVATEDIAQALTTMLQVNKTLTHLDLSDNSNFSDQGACWIFQGLQHNNTLVDLNLSLTRIEMTMNTAIALGKMLQVNNSLTHLDLSNNCTFYTSGTWFIFNSLKYNTTLVQLNLSNTGLVATVETAQALTTMLQVNKTLTHLDLSSNLLRFESYVFQGLQNNATLVYLNLRDKELRVKKDTPLAKALTTMLQENKHLKYLDLSCNPLYDEGVYCLCEGLQYNTTLVCLNLSDTGITDKGAEYIARAYNSNRSLQLTLVINKYTIRDYTRMEDSWRNDTLKLI